MEGDREAVVRDDHWPERREILKAGSGEEDGRFRERRSEPSADLPGLHGGVLELDRGRVPLGRTSYGAMIPAVAECAKHTRPGGSVGMKPEPGVGLGPDGGGPVVSRGDLDVDASVPAVGIEVLDLRIGVKHPALGVDGEAELPGNAVPFGGGGPAPREGQDLERRSLRSLGRGLLGEPVPDPSVHGPPRGVGMSAEVSLGRVPQRDRAHRRERDRARMAKGAKAID